MSKILQGFGILGLVIGGLFLTMWLLMASYGDDTLGPVPLFAFVFSLAGLALMAFGSAGTRGGSARAGNTPDQDPSALNVYCGKADLRDPDRRCVREPEHEGDHHYGILAMPQAKKGA